MQELSILVILLILQGITLISMLFLASRGTGLLLNLFVELDGKIAEAITKLMQEGLPDFEPPNPIQALIAQMIQQRVSDAAPRAPSGQFIEVEPKN